MSDVVPAVIDVKCPACGSHEDIVVDWTDHQRWAEDGEDIDTVLASLSDWERRMLTGGICQPCWEIFNG